MTPQEFLATDSARYSGPLQALWHAGHNNWHQAHNIAQSEDTREAAWVHAYLHRAEGDTTNANYWYRRAVRPPQTGDLHSEWETITREFLATED